MGGWFRKEINSVEDLKGLKFRIGGMGGPVLARLGVVPQQIAHADVYAALERGTIDAAEFVGPYDDEKLGCVQGREVQLLPRLVGKRRHAAPGRQSREMERAAQAYQASSPRPAMRPTHWMLAKYDAVNPAALKRLVAAGAVTASRSRSRCMEACYKAANEHYAETGRQGPAVQEGATTR